MGRMKRLWRKCREPLWGVLAFLGAVILLGAACGMIGGCAIAQKEGGGYVLGFPLSGDGASPDAVGGAAGGLIGTLTGNPAIGLGAGGLITAALTGIGWAKSSGRHKGWDENEDDRLRQTGIIATTGVRPVAYSAGGAGPAGMGTT